MFGRLCQAAIGYGRKPAFLLGFFELAAGGFAGGGRFVKEKGPSLGAVFVFGWFPMACLQAMGMPVADATPAPGPLEREHRNLQEAGVLRLGGDCKEKHAADWAACLQSLCWKVAWINRIYAIGETPMRALGEALAVLEEQAIF